MTSSKANLVTVLALLLVAPVFAQTKPAATSGKDCYGEYYKLFRERGAKAIPDGTQDIVISIRKEGYSECFLGKVDVENGKMKFPVMVAHDDGSYGSLAETGLKLDPGMAASTSSDALATITDGMSITAYTADREAVKIFFYKYVNDKPKKNKVAPPASTLIKN